MISIVLLSVSFHSSVSCFGGHITPVGSPATTQLPQQKPWLGWFTLPHHPFKARVPKHILADHSCGSGGSQRPSQAYWGRDFNEGFSAVLKATLAAACSPQWLRPGKAVGFPPPHVPTLESYHPLPLQGSLHQSGSVSCPCRLSKPQATTPGWEDAALSPHFMESFWRWNCFLAIKYSWLAEHRKNKLFIHSFICTIR